MAIDLRTMYIQNAHRLSLYEIESDVQEVYAGQLFQLSNDGKWEYADGTKKAYPTLNNRFGGLGFGDQGERLEGRDDVSRAGKLACLKGNFEIATDQYDTEENYVPGDALVPSTDPAKKGKVTKWDGSLETIPFIVGYVTQKPLSTQPVLTSGMKNNYDAPDVASFLRYEG